MLENMTLYELHEEARTCRCEIEALEQNRFAGYEKYVTNFQNLLDRTETEIKKRTLAKGEAS